MAEDSTAARAKDLAERLAVLFSVPVSAIHLDTNDSANPSDPTPAATLAAAISEQVDHHHLLVIESAHADRWRSRNSVAEHLIDLHPNTTVAIGPTSHPGFAEGPIVVALDGSDRALTGLAAAQQLGEALDRPLLLARVVAESDADQSDAAEQELRGCSPGASVVVPISNDPISALVSVCADSNAALVVLASSGDRETKRSSMSRTTAGLIAEARCPVVVVPPAAADD